MHNRVYRCFLNTFEAFLNRKLVHLNFPPLQWSVPCIFPPLRTVFGASSIIFLDAVADGSSFWLLPLRISPGFDFLVFVGCVSEPFTFVLSVVADGVLLWMSTVAQESKLSFPDPKSHPMSDHWFLFHLTCSPLRRKFSFISRSYKLPTSNYYLCVPCSPLRIGWCCGFPPLRKVVSSYPPIWIFFSSTY